MSLNQSAQVGVEGYGGILLGGYDPSEDGSAVPTKARKRATTAAIVKGQVLTIVKTGGDKGKIRTAISGDFGPFAMAWKDKVINETRIEFISRDGFVGYVEAGGTIVPGMPVVAAAGGKVVEADVSSTIFDDDNMIVGYCEGKAIEVSKRASGTETPSNVSNGDIAAVKFTYTGVV